MDNFDEQKLGNSEKSQSTMMRLSPVESWIAVANASGSDGQKSSNRNDAKLDRHCAFCLILIPAEHVKCCSQCHRRAYCSRRCQSRDWTPLKGHDGKKSGAGQGHKDWCGIPYGEEDLDWKIAQIDGKGQGIVARRFIPANSRILVDGLGFGKSDILTKDSFHLTESMNGHRSILVNHACDGNASRWADSDYMTMILYSKRDILPHQEISVNYIVYNETHSTTRNPFKPGKFITSFADSRQALESRWNIICPPECFCRNEAIDKLISEGRLMDASLLDDNDDEITPTEAAIDLQIIKQLLENHPKVHGSAIQKALVLEKAFRVAIQRNETLPMAALCIREAHTIWSSILHPAGTCAVQAEKYMSDPSICDKYLILEKTSISINEHSV